MTTNRPPSVKRLIFGMTTQLTSEQAAALKTYLEERIPDREVIVLGGAAFIQELEDLN